MLRRTGYSKIHNLKIISSIYFKQTYFCTNKLLSTKYVFSLMFEIQLLKKKKKKKKKKKIKLYDVLYFFSFCILNRLFNLTKFAFEIN